MVKKIKKWEPEEFELEMNTVWKISGKLVTIYSKKSFIKIFK